MSSYKEIHPDHHTQEKDSVTKIVYETKLVKAHFENDILKETIRDNQKRITELEEQLKGAVSIVMALRKEREPVK